MDIIYIDLKGADIASGLSAIDLHAAVERAINACLLDIQRIAVLKIPVPPVGTTYRRGQDARSEKMTAQITSAESGIKLVPRTNTTQEGRFGVNASYAPHVIGDNQAAVHLGRWFVLHNEAMVYEAQARRQFEYEIQRALSGRP